MAVKKTIRRKTKKQKQVPTVVKRRARKKAKKKQVPAAVKKKAVKKKAQRKAKKKPKVRFEARPARGRHRQLRELREGLECKFSIENQRAERVTIFCVDSNTGKLVRVKS